MSHFTVLIIGENPEKQLAPFNENIEMPEYVKNPVSDDEKKRMIDYYVKEKGFKYDNNFDELYRKYGDDWNSYRWRKHTDGSWHEYSTYNPNSKWDWYQLGGRWSGLIKLKPGKNGKKGKAGVGDNEVGIDQALKGDISNLQELKTFAVLKDGKWYERGEMGWWGVVLNEKDKDEWDTQFDVLIKSLPDNTLISIYDCHI